MNLNVKKALYRGYAALMWGWGGAGIFSYAFALVQSPQQTAGRRRFPYLFLIPGGQHHWA